MDAEQNVAEVDTEAANRKRWAAGQARHERNLEIQRAESKWLRHIRGLFNNPKLHGRKQRVG